MLVRKRRHPLEKPEKPWNPDSCWCAHVTNFAAIPIILYHDTSFGIWLLVYWWCRIWRWTSSSGSYRYIVIYSRRRCRRSRRPWTPSPNSTRCTIGGSAAQADHEETRSPVASVGERVRVQPSAYCYSDRVRRPGPRAVVTAVSFSLQHCVLLWNAVRKAGPQILSFLRIFSLSKSTVGALHADATEWAAAGRVRVAAAAAAEVRARFFSYFIYIE